MPDKIGLFMRLYKMTQEIERLQKENSTLLQIIRLQSKLIASVRLGREENSIQYQILDLLHHFDSPLNLACNASIQFIVIEKFKSLHESQELDVNQKALIEELRKEYYKLPLYYG